MVWLSSQLSMAWLRDEVAKQRQLSIAKAERAALAAVHEAASTWHMVLALRVLGQAAPCVLSPTNRRQSLAHH